ncbi:MAG: hypothetical protein GF311_12080 [Candidatus Lokiarchaeota archaeon]|nr:hypothetical protein [Candidatus Lokiarchaeota archaeon]
MNLKFVKGTRFLFGKIKFADKLIFDLEKIEENKYLRDYLEEKLDLIVPPPYFKPPKKGTILGHLKETIRFNDAFFISGIENKVESILDSISFGLGEKGYYYDINLKTQEIEVGKLREELQVLKSIIDKMELNFENKLANLYYPGTNKKNRDFSEISNFQATVQENNFLEKNLTLLNSMIKILNNKSDIIVEEGNNFSLPEIKINLFNDYLFESIDLFKEKAKPLFDQRFFQFKKLLSRGNYWSISSRGVPLESIIRIFSLFE